MTYLKQYFVKRSVTPKILSDSINHSLFSKGKAIRPILCLTAYETCGGVYTDILPQASAIELIHTYSLIHDDLPAMDDDDLRRGRPTNHKVYGEAVAILAGDALLTEAFYMYTSSFTVNGGLLIEALKELSSAAGLDGMVAGQVMDIMSESKTPDIETLKYIHTNKTAALLRASVMTGAILSGIKGSELYAMKIYGENIGMTFQIVDDILDITATTEELGKPKGSDLEKNKMTYPSLYGLVHSKKLAKDHIETAIASIESFREKAHWLREIANYLLKRGA
ncbi:MAG: polyprenyl synthetase family protein [Nitrospirae bacterium]|nr:polyprenyl synthetase family protein [Nitrospirota bacterium]